MKDTRTRLFQVPKKTNPSVISNRSDRNAHDTTSPDMYVINLLKRIYEQTPEGVVCFSCDNRIMMVNDSMVQLLGFREEELLGKDIAHIHSDIQAFTSQLKTATTSKRQPITFEEILIRKDGEEVVLEVSIVKIKDDHGNVLCFIQRFHDIAEKTELLRNLRVEQDRFNIIANHSYNWEWWAKPDGSFIYMSPSCERISGYSAKDFLDDPGLFHRIIFPEDEEKWILHVHCREYACRRELQIRIIRKDGKVRWLEHCCQAIVNEEGKLLGFRSSNQDITVKKKFEEDLQQSLAEIERIKEIVEGQNKYPLIDVQVSKNFPDIIGNSDAMQYVFFKIEQISETNTTVLLLGETGTGKELIAKSIHKASSRSAFPLTIVNCAALPCHLIESELFGHEKGSFTGAHARHIGHFEQADKGTIFLDEIGELPLELQAKLLRVLQEGEFERLGGTKIHKVDIRVIAATNRDLENEVREARFRSDLWYRINVFPITAPPLRERDGDIAQLATYFTKKHAQKHKMKIPAISKDVMNKLMDYLWPGNVRELENVIESAVINSSGGRLKLIESLKSPQNKTANHSYKTLQEMERNYILQVLEKTGWKVSGKNSASEILGLKRSTLRARMAKYGIEKP